MIFQHAGCENQQIDLQLARMTLNVLNDPSKCAQPIHEAISLRALSSRALSEETAGSDSQPNAMNTDEKDWTLFPKVSDGLVTPNLDIYPDPTFEDFVNVANVCT